MAASPPRSWAPVTTARERTCVPLPITTGEVVAQHRRMPSEGCEQTRHRGRGRSQTSQLLGKARGSAGAPARARMPAPRAVVASANTTSKPTPQTHVLARTPLGQVCEFVSAPGPASDAIDAFSLISTMTMRSSRVCDIPGAGGRRRLSYPAAPAAVGAWRPKHAEAPVPAGST